MSGSAEPDPPRTEVDARLDALLAEVRDAPVPDTPQLTGTVVRTARWQRGVRGALLSLGSLGGAIGEAIVVLLGLRHKKGD